MIDIHIRLILRTHANKYINILFERKELKRVVKCEGRYLLQTILYTFRNFSFCDDLRVFVQLITSEKITIKIKHDFSAIEICLKIER